MTGFTGKGMKGQYIGVNTEKPVTLCHPSHIFPGYARPFSGYSPPPLAPRPLRRVTHQVTLS
jgi:hypothetical protein